MALPAGVVQLGTFKGGKGDKGDTGSLAYATAETVPADQPATVTMVGPESNRGAHFEVPRGLPGVNAIENDAAVAAYLRAADSEARGALIDALLNELLTGSGVIFLDNYPREGTETDDAPRLRRALSACATFGARVLQAGAASYSLASSVAVTVANLTIRGAGKTATTFLVNGDFIGLDVTGHYVSLEDLKVETGAAARTLFSVKFGGANHGAIRRCYFQGSAATRRHGVYFSGGSMGAVEDSTFNHACIRIETWDVKVSRCYVWAMNCDYGIGIFNGTGNTTIDNVDVVPPLQSNGNGICGILVDGATGNPFNTKMSNIYLDGNGTLLVREGIIVGDGASATVITNVNANRMEADCIVIDSATNVTIIGYNGHTNNDQGSGSREIVVRQTGAQPVEKIRILGAQCLRTAAVTGVAAPAIQVEAPVAPGQVAIHDFDIKQPGAGGGYSVPEVLVPIVGGYPTQSLDGAGHVTRYRTSGSVAVAAGATGVTITLGSPNAMAYRPTPAQIHLSTEGAPLPPHRIQYTSDNQVFVGFGAAIAAAATLHWQTHLRR